MSEAENQFLEDLKDVLSAWEESLLSLEEDTFNKELYDSIFRDLHTVKGSFYMFDRKELGDLAHSIESIYEELNEANQPFSKDIIQLSLNTVDFFRETMDSRQLVEAAQPILKTLTNAFTEAANQVLENANIQRKRKEIVPFINLISLSPKIEIHQEDGHPVHFIVRDLREDASSIEYMALDQNEDRRIKSWNLLFISELQESEIQSLFLFIEDDFDIKVHRFVLRVDEPENVDLELFRNKLEQEDLKPLITELEQFSAKVSKPAPLEEKVSIEDTQVSMESLQASSDSKKASTDFIKVGRDKIEDLMNWVSELVTMQATLQNEAEKFNSDTLRHLADNMDFITENLRDTIFSVSLVPLKTLETRFTRLVNDLSHNLGKKVIFKSEGFETELDKKVISSLTDPLLHILRNCIDHGIETPQERKNKGKPESGTIRLNSYYSGNLVFIEIEDDGKGIDPNKIQEKARRKNIITEDDELTSDELVQLIFHPGFSTAETVSDVSGRGVGMDVVRRKITEIRGEVNVVSEVDKGTKIIIKIPLSLSILEGLLTKVGSTNLVFPLNTVREIHRFTKEEFYDRPPGSEILEIDGKQMSVVSLENKFSVAGGDSKTVDVITIDLGSLKKGVAVDEIKGQIKAVLKPLGEYYQDQDFISGGTILGNGELAFVLDMEKTIN